MNLSDLKQKIKNGELDYKPEDTAMDSILKFFVFSYCSLRCQPGCSVSSTVRDNKPCGIASVCAEGCAASSCASKCFYGCSGGKTIGLF